MNTNNGEHQKQVHEKLRKLKGNEGKIAKKYLEFKEEGYRTRWTRQAELQNMLLEGDYSSTEEVFRKNIYAVIEKTSGNKSAEMGLKIAANMQKYVYSESIYRRSFRTKTVSAYADRLVALLQMVYLPEGGFDVLHYLKSTKEEQNGNYQLGYQILADMIAVEVDGGNKAVIEALKEICLGENNTKLLSNVIIMGIFRSGDNTLHQLMCDLLLAAKLQEGLRQSILENADMGRLEAFLMILKTILENNLMRFSSAVRAVDVWLGLGESADDSRKRVTEKIARLAYLYLVDEKVRKEAENSKDAIELYVSLWAASVYEVAEIGTQLDKMMAGEKYQKLVAMYFVRNTDFSAYKAEMSIRYIEEPDIDVLAYLIANLELSIYVYGEKSEFVNRAKSNVLLSSMKNGEKVRGKIFTSLIKILPEIPQNGYTSIGKPFEWVSLSLTRGHIFQKLFCIAAYEGDEKRNPALLENMEYMDADSRLAFIKYYADIEKNQKEREFVFQSLGDKSMTVRGAALKAIEETKVKETEEEAIIKLLTLKTGDIRQGAVNIILGLPEKRCDLAVVQLISDKNENKRLAALDMILRLVKEEKLTREKAMEYTKQMPKISEKEKILIGELTEKKSEYKAENGYGLYDPDYANKLTLAFSAEKKNKAGVIALLKGKKQKSAMNSIFDISLTRMQKLFDQMVKLVDENKEYEFQSKWQNGQVEDCVLGTMRYMRYPEMEGKNGIDNFVLPEVWRGWLTDNKVTVEELAAFLFSMRVSAYNGYNPSYLPWAVKLVNKWFGAEKISALVQYYLKQSYCNTILGIMRMLISEFSKEERYALFYSAMMELIKGIPKEDWTKEVEAEKRYYNRSIGKWYDIAEVAFIRSSLKDVSESDEEFGQYVAVSYELGRLADMTYIGLSEVDVARAYELGLVPKDALMKLFFNSTREIGNYAGKPRYKLAKEAAEKYPILLESATQAAMRIIEIEMRRGDTPTEVSKLASSINYHEGAENFANILVALGGETFQRGYIYGSDESKKMVLSSLLKASHPAKTDTAKTLAEALDGRIDEKRLLEAAMYAPSWILIVAEYLNWKGLENAAWYFHAHINEHFSAEKETQVARYSPITAKEFNDGAFDVDWFKDAYKEIGKKRFEVLYDCAKYLTDGANHRRAQLFADASLGKLKIVELQKEIKDKRNKDKVLAYSLIPLKKDRNKDLLKRYEFIQTFLKESKQFGAQRRESEAKVCAIALDNLARTAGFADSLRLSWKMEILKLEQLSVYFQPKELEEATVFVEIDNQGIPALICEKAGKYLKSVPAKLRKDKYILECKEVIASLKAQQKRAKAALENAMIRADVFAYAEVTDLMKHPVIAPLLEKLVFSSEEKVGRYEDFAGAEGEAVFKLAHPYDLYQSGDWIKWQKYAFENEMIQPFKQIFRELYIPNEEELHENIVSRRYAGHQIQVKMTVALLKTRGWTVDYEEGLQKVYYKENIIATMYAAADWFSPADVEAPTLETVRFYDRKTYKAIPLSEIPAVLFSEVMRDIDLVVSVAHVGGVDPEASHSTVEMRGAIVRELLALLHVENVEVKERQAFVKGSLGEYTVHLGSGVCHMMGKGAINILAVPSQHRGRVFLPFADEDPRTAEIMSKILLLADDKSIKDTAILAQIG